MSFVTLTFDVTDRVATIRVNRPEKLNALNDETIAELGDAIELVLRREDVAGALLTGTGTKAFVAGADIAELSRQGALDGRARALRGQRVFSMVERSTKPVIAAVNGFALGGGCELAMACHLRIAAERAKFGQPEVKLGITPGYGGTQRLARLVGTGRALQLLLTGEMIDAAEAYRIGLVNAVVPDAEVLPTAERMMRQIIAQGPLAVALCIEAVHRGADLPLDEGLELEAAYFGLLSATQDMHEGMSAFVEKRDARFTGR
ncbi:MAG TPA: enoyl-CoA hydratase-related protein [Gemmatimonadaceae bacterium]|jgi:enoyl-CoA hydratase